MATSEIPKPRVAAVSIDRPGPAESERQARILAVAERLARATSEDEIADAVVSVGGETLEASDGAFWLLAPGTRTLRIVRSWHYSDALLARFATVSLDENLPITRPVRTGMVEWFDRRDEYVRAYPDAANETRTMAPHAVESFGCVPLFVGERAVGVFSLAFAAPQRADERRFLLVLARLASSALERLHLHGRLRRLQEVTAALSRARTAAEVAEVTCRIGGEATGASSAALWTIRDEDGALVLTGGWGANARAAAERFRVIPGDSRGVPVVDVAHTREAIWIETDEEYARIAPEIHAIAQETGTLSAFGAVPLVVESRVLGVVAFTHPLDREYSADDRAFCEALAQHSAQAVERARALDSERRSNERLRLLAAAGDIFARSLDVNDMLRSIAQLAAPSVADWCVIDLVDDGWIRRVVTANRDPERVRWAEELAGTHAVRVDDENHPVAQIVATGESRFYQRVPRALLMEKSRTKEERAAWLDVGLVSSITVPIVARAERIGMLALTTTSESERTLDREDMQLAEELGRRAGLAIANARLYRSAHDAAERAEEASSIKDEFLATVSHELRTPLNAISGWTAVLKRRLDDVDSLRKGLDVIERNARAQAKIVEDILDVSRIVTGKLKVDAKPVDLVAIVRDAIDVVRPSAEAKEIELYLNAPSDRVLLVGDAKRLQQAAWNLLSNAVKFTGERGRVTVDVAQDGPSVTLAVHDTGRGIEPEFLPHVFERFRQADGSWTRKLGGLGLGLAIVRHIVELHGGRVAVESEGVGRGSAFRVALPVRAVAPPEATKEAAARDAGAVASDGGDLDGVRVLVVDDERDARELVEMVLVEAGAIVQTACSSQEALAAVGRFEPEVIVSDVGMPGEDGYTFARELRKRAVKEGGTTPAIALTAYARGEDRVRAITAGFTTHMTKPVDPFELVATVAGVRRSARG